MPRKATGSVYESRGVWYAKVTLGPRKRPTLALPTVKTMPEALERASLIADAVRRLRRAGRSDMFAALLEQLANASGVRLVAILKVVDGLLEGREEKALAAPLEVGASFADLANRWISGELHQAHPAHVRACDHEKNGNAARLRKWSLPIVGDVPLKAFTLDHAEEVMRRPPKRSRRHVAAVLMRVLALAVYPARIIERSPTPRGWLPKSGTPRVGTYLYPEEDAALLGCSSTPLGFRVLFGFLAREGMRASEAANLLRTDLDLGRGSIRLDINKTDDPRMWAMDPGVVEGLRRWLRIAPESEYVFPSAGVPRSVTAKAPPKRRSRSKKPGGSTRTQRGERLKVRDLAAQLRHALHAAKVERQAIFEGNEVRMRLRAHDLRATFITLALAADRTEQWVSDRTGHKSSLMIQRYRRAARTAAELGLGPLRPLFEAIPELAAISPEGPSNRPQSSAPLGPSGGGENGATKVLENTVVRRAGLEPACLSALEPKASPDVSARVQASPNSADRPSARHGSTRLADVSDASRTIQRRRETALGQALDDGISAALKGEREAFDEALERAAAAHRAEREGGAS